MPRLSIAAVLVAVALATISPARAQETCAPTKPDMLGPFYKAGAPERETTGRGLVVAGTVRSTAGCRTLPGARVEWWSADAQGEYRDELRATQRADGDGRYRYETVAPGRYPGRPPHLHVRVSAPRHRVLVTQVYPQDAQRSIATDFVLLPE